MTRLLQLSCGVASANSGGPAIDFDFESNLPAGIVTTRGSLATMYDPVTGLLGYASHNLFKQSETFDTTWTKDGVTISTDGGYDGSDRMVEVADTGFHWIYQNYATAAGDPYTMRLRVRYVDTQYIAIRLRNSTPTNVYAWFDIQNGVLATVDASITASITDDGDGWYVCTTTMAQSGGPGVDHVIAMSHVDNTPSYTGTSASVDIDRSQLNRGLNATGYVATTTAAEFDTTRRGLDAEGTGLVGIQAEGAATNLLTYSEDVTHADWNKSNTGSLAIDATGPDGATSAVTLVDSGATGTGSVRIRQELTVTSGQVMTLSVFAKADQLDFLLLRTLSFDASANDISGFDLSDGTVVTAGPNHGATNITPELKLGEGWYRCSIEFTTTTDLFGGVYIYVSEDGLTASSDLDGTSSILIYGAMLNEGKLTSYIPTGASTETRLAEVHTYTLEAGLIAALGIEGTIYSKFSMAGDGSSGGGLRMALSLNGGGTTESQDIWAVFGGVVPGTRTRDGGITVASANHADIASGVVAKIAQSWKSDDVSATHDGVSQPSDNPGAVPTITQLQIGCVSTTFQLNGFVYDAQLFESFQENSFREGLTT